MRSIPRHRVDPRPDALSEAEAMARRALARRRRFVQALVAAGCLAIGFLVAAWWAGDPALLASSALGCAGALALSHVTGRAHGHALRAVQEVRRLRRLHRDTARGAPLREPVSTGP